MLPNGERGNNGETTAIGDSTPPPEMVPPGVARQTQQANEFMIPARCHNAPDAAACLWAALKVDR
jgi:hypothetical protein